LLRASGINPQKEVARGALLLSSPEEAYLVGGQFDRHAMIKFLDEAMQEAINLGFTGFRGTGDLSWAARDTGACAQMAEYEAMLNKFRVRSLNPSSPHCS
jgi:hypothetical protein